MKKFEFTLERILSFKRTLYEKERSALAHLRARRAGIQQRRDDTETQILQKDAEFRHKAASGGVRAQEVATLNFQRESSTVLIEQLDTQIAALDIEIEKQLEVVIALDKEVKSLEKLRETQWEEYVAEAARQEQERISEIVSGKFAEEQRNAQ